MEEQEEQIEDEMDAEEEWMRIELEVKEEEDEEEGEDLRKKNMVVAQRKPSGREMDTDQEEQTRVKMEEDEEDQVKRHQQESRQEVRQGHDLLSSLQLQHGQQDLLHQQPSNADSSCFILPNDLSDNSLDESYNKPIESASEDQRGYLIPTKRPLSKVDYKDLLPCDGCLGWFIRSDMWKHKKLCVGGAHKATWTKHDIEIPSPFSASLPTPQPSLPTPQPSLPGSEETILARLNFSHPIAMTTKSDDLPRRNSSQSSRQMAASCSPSYTFSGRRTRMVTRRLQEIRQQRQAEAERQLQEEEKEEEHQQVQGREHQKGLVKTMQKQLERVVNTSDVQGFDCDTISNGGDSFNPSRDVMATVSTSDISLGERQASQEAILLDDIKEFIVKMRPSIVADIVDSDSQEDALQNPKGQRTVAVVSQPSQSMASSAKQTVQLQNLSDQLEMNGIPLVGPLSYKPSSSQTIPFIPPSITNPKEPIPMAISVNPVKDKSVQVITREKPAPDNPVKVKLKTTVLSRQSQGNMTVVAQAVDAVTRQKEVKVASQPSLDTHTSSEIKKQQSTQGVPKNKRQKYLEMCRAATTRYRNKRKQLINNMEKRVKELTRTNVNLNNEVSKLHNEVAHLKELLLAHTFCPITLQQRAAGMFSRDFLQSRTPCNNDSSLNSDAVTVLESVSGGATVTSNNEDEDNKRPIRTVVNDDSQHEHELQDDGSECEEVIVLSDDETSQSSSSSSSTTAATSLTASHQTRTDKTRNTLPSDQTPVITSQSSSTTAATSLTASHQTRTDEKRNTLPSDQTPVITTQQVAGRPTPPLCTQSDSGLQANRGHPSTLPQLVRATRGTTSSGYAQASPRKFRSYEERMVELAEEQHRFTLRHIHLENELRMEVLALKKLTKQKLKAARASLSKN